MEVKNLVFNKLGNSISILIDYSDTQIQIWDDVEFPVKNGYAQVSALDVDYHCKLCITLKVFNNGIEKSVNITFDNEKLKFLDFELYPVEEGFKGEILNDGILFKISMNPVLSKYLEQNSLVINQHDFFKHIANITLNLYF